MRCVIRRFFPFLLILACFFLSPASRAEFKPSQGKISGEVFGDFFGYARHHNANLEGDTGFWLRRIYFTYDYPFNEDFSMRFRLEANSNDLTQNSATLNPFVKEASLKWKPAAHGIQGGLIPTATWPAIVEPHWGYRSVEKTPVDLQRLGSAVDMGLAIFGAFGEEEKFGYHLMFGNGAGTRSEANDEKKAYGSFHLKPVKELVFQIYGDFEKGPGGTDRTTTFIFSGYTKENWRAGLLFVFRLDEIATGGWRDSRILSGHGAFKLREKLWTFVRADRMFDPNPDGANIQYLPFSNNTESTLLLAGLDFEPAKNVHLMPNMEAILYDTVSGTRPGPDLVPRLTFFWQFH